MRELFGVEFVDGVVDSSPVGEIDASVGESGGDLFGWAPTALVVEGVAKGGQVGVDSIGDWAIQRGSMPR